MKKTFALFFLLGLMVSCASNQERSVSSIGEQDSYEHKPHFEPRSMNR